MKAVWKKLEAEGVQTEILDRTLFGGRERDVPDLILQREMLNDACQITGGTVVLLTGDGSGSYRFLQTLKSMKKREWNIELMSWYNCSNMRLRRWVQDNGHFTCLDKF